MIDSYLCMDGNPISTSKEYKGDKTLKDVVANRDPRLNQTIFVDDGKYALFPENNEIFTTPDFAAITKDNSCPTGYQVIKGFNTNYNECRNGLGTIATIYFRYAEALLINAEAKAELGTITQQDIDKTINALRKRVGMTAMLDINHIPDDPNREFKDVSPLLNEIRRERKVELACEGFRHDDIFRWAAADELIAGKLPLGAVKAQWANYPGTTDKFKEAWAALKTDKTGHIDPFGKFIPNGYNFNLKRDYLSPLPTNELTLNKNLKQNPGW